MKTVTLEDADAQLAELILRLERGEEVTLTLDGRPFARVERLEWGPRAGTAKHPDNWMAPDFDAPMDENGEDAGAGKAGCYRKEGFWMAPDFDAPLDDFKEYTG